MAHRRGHFCEASCSAENGTESPRGHISRDVSGVLSQPLQGLEGCEFVSLSLAKLVYTGTHIGKQLSLLLLKPSWEAAQQLKPLGGEAATRVRAFPPFPDCSRLRASAWPPCSLIHSMDQGFWSRRAHAALPGDTQVGPSSLIGSRQLRTRRRAEEKDREPRRQPPRGPRPG